MKKIVFTFLVVVFTLSLCTSVTAVEGEAKLLSEMSNEECLAFVNRYNIEIPGIYDQEMDAVPFIRAVLAEKEADPDTYIPCTDIILTRFANEIRAAIDEYYGISEMATYASSQSSSSSTLQDNVVHGTWLDEFEDYNCYAYAIGKKEWLSPGFSFWLDLGESLSTYPYEDTANISSIANWVKGDLEYYGYIVQTPTTTMPNTLVSAHTRLICVRKDVNGNYYRTENGTIVFLHDFHFMTLETDGFWYHKPGATNPLRYLNTPSNDTIWVQESYDGNVYSRNESYIYDSIIYYIEFTTPHSYEYAAGPNGTHTRTCTICNASEVLSCDLHTEYSGSGAHVTTCTYCDRLDFASCTGVLTHYEDETLGDAHKTVCRDCGNDMGGTGEACTIDYVFVGTIDGVNHHARFCTECGYRKTANFSCAYANSGYCRFCGTHKDRLQAVALHL